MTDDHRRWREIRNEILQRDDYTCTECGATGSQAVLEVHHIVPKENGGEDVPDNLTTLCRKCHEKEHGNTIDKNNLGETDKKILERLEGGRETTGSLADNLDKHPQTIRDRLAWLREWGYVRRYHESTGLHEKTSEN